MSLVRAWSYLHYSKLSLSTRCFLNGCRYGDIVPLTNVEYIVTAIYMIIGGVIWAYLIGSLTTIVTNLNHHQAHFKHIMDELNCECDWTV